MFEERAAYLALAITAALGPTACHQMQSPATQTHIVSCSCHNHHHHHRKKDTPTPSTTHVQVPSFAFFVHRVYSFPVAGDAGQQGDEMKKLKLKVERQDPPSSPNYLPSSMEWYVILQDLKTLQHQCIFWKVVCSMCKVCMLLFQLSFFSNNENTMINILCFQRIHPPKLTVRTWKWTPGRWDSYWKPCIFRCYVSFKEGTPRYLGHTFRKTLCNSIAMEMTAGPWRNLPSRAEPSVGLRSWVFVRKKRHGFKGTWRKLSDERCKTVKLYQNDMWYALWGLNTPSMKRNYGCVSKMTGPQQNSCFCYVFWGNYYIISFVSSGPSILKRPPMVRIDNGYMICLCLFWVFLAGG